MLRLSVCAIELYIEVGYLESLLIEKWEHPPNIFVHLLKGKDSNLAIRYQECNDCEPLYDAFSVTFRGADQRTREIVEAAEMQRDVHMFELERVGLLG